MCNDLLESDASFMISTYAARVVKGPIFLKPKFVKVIRRLGDILIVVHFLEVDDFKTLSMKLEARKKTIEASSPVHRST